MLSLGDLPPLESLDLEEYEPGLYTDTARNRRTLIRSGHRYDTRYVETPDGELVPLLHVQTPEEREALARGQHDRLACVLRDPDSRHSEFVVPLPDELTHDAPVPAWVKSSGRKWQTHLDAGLDPEAAGLWLPVRCRYVKQDGTRCWAWSGSSREQREHGFCRTHLLSSGTRHEHDIALARSRVYSSAPDAAHELIELAFSAEAEPVRLRAIESLLDRAGIRGGTELDVKAEVTQVDAAQLVRERLEQLRAATAPAAITGEVVE